MKYTNDMVSYEDYRKFNCTGPACPDNCCRASTWSIIVDQDTYKRYENMEDGFKDELLNSIDWDDSEQSHKMLPNKQGFCKMVDQNGLCEIHKRYGHDYLCDTCKNYPRSIKEFNQNMEASFTLSCPVVAKMFLTKKKGVGFKLHYVVTDTEPKHSQPSTKEAIAYAVRAATVSILGHRDFSLQERLVYLGLMFKSLSKTPVIGDYENAVYDVLDLYEGGMTTPDMLKVVREKLEKLDQTQISAFYLVVRSALLNFIKLENSPMNVKLYNKVREYVEVDGLEFALKTISLQKELIQPYMEANPYVFENYLVMEVYETLFPLKFDSYDLAYKTLMSQFILLQLFITSVHCHKEFLTTDDVINCIYLFHRKKSHSKMPLEVLANYCKDNPDISYATIAAMLFNNN